MDTYVLYSEQVEERIW